MYEPLFSPTLVEKTCLSLQELMHISMTNTYPEKRLQLHDNVLLIGELADVEGLKTRLEFEYAPYIAASETSHESQAKEIKFLKELEYLTAYKSAKNAGYLGAVIALKVIFIVFYNYVEGTCWRFKEFCQ